MKSKTLKDGVNCRATAETVWIYASHDRESRSLRILLPSRQDHARYRNVVNVRDLDRFVQRRGFVGVTLRESVVVLFIEGENVQQTRLVGDHPGGMKHLSHVKLSAVAVTAIRGHIRSPLGGGRRSPNLHRIIDVLFLAS